MVQGRWSLQPRESHGVAHPQREEMQHQLKRAVRFPVAVRMWRSRQNGCTSAINALTRTSGYNLAIADWCFFTTEGEMEPMFTQTGCQRLILVNWEQKESNEHIRTQCGPKEWQVPEQLDCSLHRDVINRLAILATIMKRRMAVNNLLSQIELFWVDGRCLIPISTLILHKRRELLYFLL